MDHLNAVKVSEDAVRDSAWDLIPGELRTLDQWCYTSPMSEVPKAPRTRNGVHASPTDPRDWLSFSEACELANRYGGHVGFMLSASDPYCCIDLDVKEDTPQDCLDRHSLVVDHCDSYTELSIGGKGAHVWVRAQVGKGRRRDGIEIYDRDRFIICTGRILRAAPICSRQEMVSWLWEEAGRNTTPAVVWSDPEDADSYHYVASLAFDDNGRFKQDELGRLFQGDWQGRYPSQSEADLALVTKLAQFTESDRECWEAFRLSALGKRDKAARLDYMRSTMAAARANLAVDAASIAHGSEVARALLEDAATKGSCEIRSSPPLLLSEQDLFGLPEPTWILRSIIQSNGVGAIFGPSGAGKSFLVLDLLSCIANGKDWFGFKVKKVPCVYIAFEGQSGLPKRVRAWTKKARDRGMTTSNMQFILGGFDIRKPLELERFLVAMEDQNFRNGVVCFDTLAQAAPGFEENSSEGMGEIIGILNRVQRRLGGVILAVHHSGKDVERGLRGWSGLAAALDFAIECASPGKNQMLRRFSLSKVKDDTTGASHGYQLERVTVGVDSEGLPITSLAVTPLGASSSDQDFDALTKQIDMQDDEFCWRWIRKESDLGNFPTGNSLEGQRQNAMRPERSLSQARLRNAIARLKAESRVRNADFKAPAGHIWLEAVGEPRTGNLMDLVLQKD